MAAGGSAHRGRPGLSSQRPRRDVPTSSVYIYNTSPGGSRKILALILAAVNAALPEPMAQEAVRDGAMGPMLFNSNYTIAQRLLWLKARPTQVFLQKVTWGQAADLAEPLKDAVMLCFFMAANKGETSLLNWMRVGLDESVTSKREFLERNAPGLLPKIDIVHALDLSYSDAVDLLIGYGNGLRPTPPLDLPDIEGPQRA